MDYLFFRLFWRVLDDLFDRVIPGKKKIFHQLIHSLDSYNDHGRVRLNGQKLLLSLPHGFQGPSSWATLLFPSYYHGARQKVEHPGHQLVSIWNTGVVGSSFTYYAIMPTPITYIHKTL